MAIALEIDLLDTGSGDRVTLRAVSSQDYRITGMNDERWIPAIYRKPRIDAAFFDGDFVAGTGVPSASITLDLSALAVLDSDVRSYVWQGATARLWSGNAGDSWPWTAIFTGRVISFDNRDATVVLTMQVDREPFVIDVLAANYAGNGDAEGGDDLKDQPKPWLIGFCENVEPVLIDAVNLVYQFSGYGEIQSVNVLYERGSSFGTVDADYADYDALVAATLAPGKWATCLAEGLVRLGAPAFGVITGDVEGHVFAGGYKEKPGELCIAILDALGVSSSLVNDSSFTALDTAMSAWPNAGKIGLYLSAQESADDLVRRICLAANGFALISPTGVIYVRRPVIAGSASVTLDAQGRQEPAVISTAGQNAQPPFRRIEMGGRLCWRVHSYGEIAFYDEIIDKGRYNPLTVYREGNIVDLADQSRWIYTNPVPTAGNLPASGSSYWSSLSPELTAPDIGVEEGATRNTKEFNDDLNYADTAGFLERWAVLSPNGEGNIAMEADSAAPGGRALAFSAPDTGGGDTIASTVTSSSLYSGLSGNSHAALSDGTFDDATSVVGTDSESNPYIRIDLGSVQSVGNVKIAGIAAALAGPGEGAIFTGATYTASSNYLSKYTALNSNGAGMRDGTFAGSTSIHGTDADGGAPWIMIDLGSDQYVSTAHVTPVTSGDPDGWSPAWLDGAIIEYKTEAAGSYTSAGTCASSANGVEQDFNINATCRYIRARRTTSYLAVGDFYVRGAGAWGVDFINGVKLQKSDDASSWTDIVTLSGLVDDTLGTVAVDDDCRYLQVAIAGTGQIGVGDFYAQTPVIGGSTDDSLEYEANTRILIEPGALYVATFTVAGDGATANNFEAGISCFNAAGDRTRLNIAADQDDVTTDYTVFKGYFRASTGSAVEPASDPTDPCLMPSGTVEIAARFLCDTGNEDFILAGSVSIDKIDDSTAEAGADQTTANQVAITLPAIKTVAASYLGVVSGDLLPVVFSPTVKKGGVSVKLSNNTNYALSDVTGGTVSVDNSNGSSTKGDVSVTAIDDGKGAVVTGKLTVTVDGQAQPPIPFLLNKDVDNPPASTSSLVTASANGAFSTTSYVEIASLGSVTVGSGQSLYGTGTVSYTIDGTTYTTRTAQTKFQYENPPSTWNDFNTAKTGTAAVSGYTEDLGGGEYDYHNPVPGSVDTAQTKATPGAGTYAVRLVAKLDGTGRTATPSGTVQVEAAA